MQLSVVVSVYILSSKGTNQLQVLYIRTLGNIQGNLLLKVWSSKVFPAIFFCRSFRTTAEKLALESYVLAYHTADNDHAKIL